MFLQQTMAVISAFTERYVPFVNENGDYSHIATTEDNKVCFTFTSYLGSSYNLFAWINNAELHIENDRNESIFDYSEEHGWTKEDVHYMKFGTRPSNTEERKTCNSRFEWPEIEEEYKWFLADMERKETFCSYVDESDYEDEYSHNQIDEFQSKFIEKVTEWLHENKPGQYIVSGGYCVFIMTIEEAKKRNILFYEQYIVK